MEHHNPGIIVLGFGRHSPGDARYTEYGRYIAPAKNTKQPRLKSKSGDLMLGNCAVFCRSVRPSTRVTDVTRGQAGFTYHGSVACAAAVTPGAGWIMRLTWAHSLMAGLE